MIYKSRTFLDVRLLQPLTHSNVVRHLYIISEEDASLYTNCRDIKREQKQES